VKLYIEDKDKIKEKTSHVSRDESRCT